MKNYILPLLLLLSSFLRAQTGINTTDPKATLDVALPATYTNGQAAGVSIPMLDGTQIDAMNTAEMKDGTLVYVKSASTSTTSAIKNAGLWIWRKSWMPMYANAPNFFYSPAIPIDTSVLSGSIDLYTTYKNQFSAPMASSSAESKLPIYNNGQLDYFVTYYDTQVFSNVSISPQGVLSYTVNPDARNRDTFMNVVFLVKQ